MNDWAQRKPLRLKEYDYSKPGYYFVTICTRERGTDILASAAPPNDTLVGAIINRPSPDHPQVSVQPSPSQIVATPWGNIVERAIHDIPHHYSSVTVDMYAIMPDHVHLLLIIKSPEAEGGGRQIAAPTVTVSTVIQQLKRVVSREAGQSIWQKGYYDHIVRNDEDLQTIRQYIQNNPANWLLNQSQIDPVP